jgi:leucyl-tRNA synthetase
MNATGKSGSDSSSKSGSTEYQFREIEKKWQAHWSRSGAYTVSNDSSRPKYYVLDMFPYPSGAGLHVGHPLGYISSDIYARYKRLKGFNVLHPMGYDAFGLPAEQYAIEHGIHPAVSTDNNIKTFRSQLDNIGFCFDWTREVKTSDPHYYKWTQWIFLQLFNSFYNRNSRRAEPIQYLIDSFERSGNASFPIPNDKSVIAVPKDGKTTMVREFNAGEWNAFDGKTKQDILMEYRLAYCGVGEVNWCEALGTVLANDEVINGVSERGGFPVVRKKLRQWYLRITEYADRLLEGLTRVDYSDAMKEMQSNWIGRSSGAEIDFAIKGSDEKLKVYTTRPDTIFGVDFMVVAPELELIDRIKSASQAKEVDDYIAYVKSRSDRERQAEKKITGAFTGAYAINPFDGKEIPVWISEYVLAGYGTGAIMAVPCGDQRDFLFAKHFSIPITNIIGNHYTGEEANPTKDAILQNSGFINGMPMRDAIDVVISKIEEMGIGVRKVNYRMRDAAFSRQRYWGEPFPIQWKNGVAYPLPENELPLELPHVDSYRPGPEGEGPLANIPSWVAKELETNTMPGYAGSSWYFLRYMDPQNDQEFCSRKASDYWGQVDLYIGGTEHAVGHLLYSRMWTKALYDLGYISHDEPFKKLVNQGMIQGSSRFVYRVRNSNEFVSAGLKDQYETDELHVDVNMVDGLELDTEAFRQWREEYADASFILENGKYICGALTEKMSKRLYNTVNPDTLVERYGADTFRMYEMFLGPVEQSKPWDTKGIEGVHRFLRKLWRLFYDETKGSIWTSEAPSESELKVLHRTIKKIDDDTERFSFNTGVSGFMIAVNELSEIKCHKKSILENLLILLAPYAPHIAEELWSAIGNKGSILDAGFPVLDPKYLVESSKEYPISVNGKLRTTMSISLEATQADIESIILENDVVKKWLDGKHPKKVIFVKGKMINIVI